MAVTAYWYANAFLAAFDKEIDFLADDINAQLHTSSYTPNQDSHDYEDDLTNEVANGNGYTTGGVALNSKTNVANANVITFDSADPQWTATGAGFTADKVVYVDKTPASAAANPLLWWMDFDGDQTASGGGTFTIQHNASGIATITAADAA